MSEMTSASDVTREAAIAVLKTTCAGATEGNPKRFGNVDFWLVSGELCFSLHTSQWDNDAVQADIEREAVVLGMIAGKTPYSSPSPRHGDRRYLLRSLGYSSDRYGVCEACGGHCTEVFLQSTECYFEVQDVHGRVYKGWSHVNDSIGHEACLRGKQVTGARAVHEHIALADFASVGTRG